MYLSIIQDIIPEISVDDISLPLVDLGIDSIDLVTLRVEFEREIGESIPDSQWLCFETFSDIIAYCNSINLSVPIAESEKTKKGVEKEITIDMPQMAIEALSENWLFKELGNIHWQLLCSGLKVPSFDLKDELGNRLYATFVRIHVQSTGPLNEYKENEILKIDGDINRYGNSMYFSDISLSTNKSSINAKLMTSFSIRNDTDNTKLVKSQPNIPENTIQPLSRNPEFSDEYRLIKKNLKNEIKIGDEIFHIKNDYIYKTTYKINPYYDLNGVGLLYFASYPIINDVCEASYFNNKENEQRWETTYYTLSRDIFYYANCNIDDKLIYKLHSYDKIDEDTVKISSSLERESDNKLISRIFVIKRKNS